MPRHALRVFFERVIIASLPLVMPACGASHSTPSPDMAVGGVGGDRDMSQAAGDLAGGSGPDLLAPPDLDTCEINHQVVYANIPADMVASVHFIGLCAPINPDAGLGGACISYCPPTYSQCCGPTKSDGGATLVACQYNCGPTGRRPAGLATAQPDAGCAVGQYFAAMAHLEAASVHAFRTLERELAAHGAPRSLVRAARRSLREEIRHARLTRTMALRHGSRPAPVTVAATTERSLEAIATENAVEGCVRETYGALVAAWQARAAGDAEVRTLMTEIADDEASHAELAWAVDAWTRTRLDLAARRRVKAARAAAVSALISAETAAPMSPELVAQLGLPDPSRARQFLEATQQALWA